MDSDGMPEQEASTRDSSLVQDLPIPVVLSNTLRILLVDTIVLSSSTGKHGSDNRFSDKAFRNVFFRMDNSSQISSVV